VQTSIVEGGRTDRKVCGKAKVALYEVEGGRGEFLMVKMFDVKTEAGRGSMSVGKNKARGIASGSGGSERFLDAGKKYEKGVINVGRQAARKC